MHARMLVCMYAYIYIYIYIKNLKEMFLLLCMHVRMRVCMYIHISMHVYAPIYVKANNRTQN